MPVVSQGQTSCWHRKLSSTCTCTCTCTYKNDIPYNDSGHVHVHVHVHVQNSKYCGWELLHCEQYILVVKPLFMLHVCNSICKDKWRRYSLWNYDLSCQTEYKGNRKQPLRLIQHCIDYDINMLSKVYRMWPWIYMKISHLANDNFVKHLCLNDHYSAILYI